MGHLNARPNLNGNTAADFKRHAREMMQAVQETREKLRPINAHLLHGRNYQHLSGDEAYYAKVQDDIRTKQAFEALQTLEQFAVDLGLAGQN